MANPQRSKLKTTLLWLPALFGFLWTVLPIPAGWVESIYSQGIYPLITSILVPLTKITSYVLALPFLAILLLTVLIYSIRNWKYHRKSETSKWKAFLKGNLGIIWLFSLVYFLFLLLWGANYRRVPIHEMLHLEERNLTDQQIRQFSEKVVETLNANYIPKGNRKESPAIQSLIASYEKEFGAWKLPYPTLSNEIKRLPKGTLIAFGTSGMYFPFTFEPLVDGALPSVAYIYVSAHELAHVAGVAHEGEADFLAILTGLKAKNSYARYSCLLKLYMKLRNELPKNIRTKMDNRLRPQVAQDIKEIYDAYQVHEVKKLSNIQGAVYDTHLKLQGLEQGINDYSRAIKFLYSAHEKGLFSVEFKD